MSAADPVALTARISALEGVLAERGRALAALAARRGTGAPTGLFAAMGIGQVVILALAVAVVAAAWGRRAAPSPDPVDDAPIAAAAIPLHPEEPARTAEPEPTPQAVAEPEAVAEREPVKESVAAAAYEPGPPILATVTTFPSEQAGTTSGSTTRVADSYSCAPDIAEGGAEAWYRVEVDRPGFLTAWLTEEPRLDVDVDVHLLSRPDPRACLQRAPVAVGMRVTAGTYWVVVDTWSGGERELPGDYTLRLDLEPER